MTRPRLSCCEPHRIPWPSGLRWTHADNCSVSPGQKVKQADYPTVVELPHQPTHPAGADLPVGGTRSARIARHHDPECACRHCLYADFWQDDKDDTFEGAWG